jgi:Fe-S cluster assembly scaffold protein SufB
MYRWHEDIEEIDRLDRENSRLFMENRELKKKLERKKYKIQWYKENLETALVRIDDVERIRYEKEQQELQHAALQNVRLAPFCDLKKEEESSIPFNDVGERIIVRDGKKIKQVKHHRGLDSNGEEIFLYQECEMTKWEIEEMDKETDKETEKETDKETDKEAEKKHVEDQIRISEEEPSIAYDYNNERIIFRNGKKYKQWFQLGFGTHIWYGEEEIACL